MSGDKKRENPLKIDVELSPEIIIILNTLCEFYKKDRRQVIEMALEHLTSDARLMSRTITAQVRKKKNE